MPEIQQIELERENDSGVQIVRGGGHGEPPINDPPPAEEPAESPGETGEPELEAQARESEQAFERAIARLPPG
jgi:DNA-directed RNA polymerase specialized sigma24 family protein